MNQITLRAAAKLNFTLDITGTRPDGYHLLRMVMQSVGVYDMLTLQKAPEISLQAAELATPQNLAWEAAAAFFAHTGIAGGVSMTLEKSIPSQAGMGGGSADAAGVLVGLNALYQAGLSTQTLQKIGETIGADVPYCIVGGTALVEGIGDLVTPLAPMKGGAFAVLKPGWGISTVEAYQAYDQAPCPNHPDTEALARDLAAGNLQNLAPNMANVLEQASGHLEEIETLRQLLLERGALAARMTGSGSAVYGVFPDLEHAKACAAQISQPGLWAFAAEPVKQGIEILSME